MKPFLLAAIGSVAILFSGILPAASPATRPATEPVGDPTCCRQNAVDVLLVPGSPPMIRLATSWRALAAPALKSSDIQAFAKGQFGDKQPQEVYGYASIDFPYGDVAMFHMMAFGYPSTNLVVLTRQQTATTSPSR
jgi:hypothetical protein